MLKDLQLYEHRRCGLIENVAKTQFFDRSEDARPPFHKGGIERRIHWLAKSHICYIHAIHRLEGSQRIAVRIGPLHPETRIWYHIDTSEVHGDNKISMKGCVHDKWMQKQLNNIYLHYGKRRHTFCTNWLATRCTIHVAWWRYIQLVGCPRTAELANHHVALASVLQLNKVRTLCLAIWVTDSPNTRMLLAMFPATARGWPWGIDPEAAAM